MDCAGVQGPLHGGVGGAGAAGVHRGHGPRQVLMCKALHDWTEAVLLLPLLINDVELKKAMLRSLVILFTRQYNVHTSDVNLLS